MRYRTTANTKALQQILVVTIVAVAFSFAATSLAMRLVFGAKANATITVSQFKTFGLTLSFFLPMLIAPLVSLHVFRLVRDLKIARANFKMLAQTDELTGLFNRRGFDAAALASLEAARTAQRPTAVLICDVDHFKRLNDSFGHGFGDKSLIHVAQVLRGFAQDHALVVGRQGGDEFVMMLAGFAIAEATEIAEGVRLACAEMHLEGSAVSARLSVSIGLAACAGGQTSLPALLRRADVALYEAKRSGRDRVVTADVDERWSNAA
jgi:diguanylate cyclase (GGDEF)-like protein